MNLSIMTYLFNLINITLDYQKFDNQCHEVNMILAKHGYFLRVFELRNKFRHLTLKNPKNKTLLDKYLVVQTKNTTVST